MKEKNKIKKINIILFLLSLFAICLLLTLSFIKTDEKVKYYYETLEKEGITTINDKITNKTIQIMYMNKNKNNEGYIKLENVYACIGTNHTFKHSEIIPFSYIIIRENFTNYYNKTILDVELDKHTLDYIYIFQNDKKTKIQLVNNEYVYCEFIGSERKIKIFHNNTNYLEYLYKNNIYINLMNFNKVNCLNCINNTEYYEF